MVIAISWEDEKTRVVFYEGYAGDKSHMEIFGMGDSLALGKKKKKSKKKNERRPCCFKEIFWSIH